MAALSALYPDILPYVPGCPDPMLDQEIRRAAREFFERARAWDDWLASITTLANVRSYTITAPTDAEVYRVKKATLDGQPLPVEIWREQDTEPETVEGVDKRVVTHDRRVLVLARNPAAGQVLKVQVALMPTRSAATIPDALLDQYGDAIAEGAKYRLMRVPGPLHKPKEAEEARALFERAIGSASHAAYRGQTDITPRAQPKWC